MTIAVVWGIKHQTEQSLIYLVSTEDFGTLPKAISAASEETAQMHSLAGVFAHNINAYSRWSLLTTYT